MEKLLTLIKMPVKTFYQIYFFLPAPIIERKINLIEKVKPSDIMVNIIFEAEAGNGRDHLHGNFKASRLDIRIK